MIFYDPTADETFWERMRRGREGIERWIRSRKEKVGGRATFIPVFTTRSNERARDRNQSFCLFFFPPPPPQARSLGQGDHFLPKLPTTPLELFGHPKSPPNYVRSGCTILRFTLRHSCYIVGLFCLCSRGRTTDPHFVVSAFTGIELLVPPRPGAIIGNARPFVPIRRYTTRVMG